jgi:hypothetical protein
MRPRIGRREFSPAVRQAALLRAYYRCEDCGSRIGLEFHHRRKLDASAFGCVVLCRDCHRQLHQRQRCRILNIS